MEILNIFYNDILKEAQNGKIDCYFTFNIRFFNNLEPHVNDDMVPILNIKNQEIFNNLLIEYVYKARSFYDLTMYTNEIENNKEYYLNKLIMTVLWSNATYEDFNDPITFLRKQISFIDKNIFEEFDERKTIGHSEILDGEVEIETVKENILNETPNSMQISITNNNERYYFPRIRYGIFDDTCYIYAVQSENESDENIKKKINRKLFKVNENFDISSDNENIYGIGNLKDVTSSFVVATNMFLGLLISKGITKIEVPSILLERWIAKERYIIEKGNYLERKGENKEEFINSERENHLNIQSNLTEKLIRTFLRVIYHQKGFSIECYPFDIDSSLHFNISESSECNNSLLDETFLITSGYKSKKL